MRTAETLEPDQQRGPWDLQCLSCGRRQPAGPGQTPRFIFGGKRQVRACPRCGRLRCHRWVGAHRNATANDAN